MFIKISGLYIPIGCLTANSISENATMLDTTTLENDGWNTSRPVQQDYSISFDGLQVNSTVAGGDFNVASYDKLKLIKRDRLIVDWQIKGFNYPVVDYGKGYITTISSAENVGEFMSFNGVIQGFGKPLVTTLDLVLLNNGDPTKIIQDGNDNLIQI